jgi:hypothetical protein
MLPALLAAFQFARAEDAKAVQQNLEAKYKLTVINAEGGVVIQGAVLVLKKSGLTAGAMNPCTNDYKDGGIVLASVSKASCNSAPGKLSRFGGLPGISRIPGAASATGVAGSGPATRPFVMGEKLYLTKIEVKDTVNFALVSDPINDVTYKAELRLQFPKGSPPDSAKADQLAGEVFSISEDNSQGGGAAAGQQAPTGQAPSPTSEAAPTPAPPQQPALAPIEAPPPPPDAPPATPPTVSLGMTIEQVVALMGQPKTVANTGKKNIYSYPGLKITFVDGKVSDIQ